MSINDNSQFKFDVADSVSPLNQKSESSIHISADNEVSSIPEVRTPVLGTFTGIFASVDAKSANNRYYSREFWEKVISSEQVQTSLKSGSMIGIFEHPIIRDIYDKSGKPTVTHPQNGAFVVKDLQIVDSYVMGEAYILNTPLGRVLSTYFLAKDKSGNPLVRLFISVRGASRYDHIDDTGVEIMDPDDYYLQTFDVVMNPGFKSAEVSMNSVYEDNRRGGMESLIDRLGLLG